MGTDNINPRQVTDHDPQPLILVGEHNKVVRASIIKRLAKEGFNVNSFDSVEAVLKGLETEAPQLVLLDYEMPGVQGDRILVEMTKLGIEVPVVFMTAQKHFVHFSPDCYHGPVSMVMKSLELEDIGSLVRTALVT